MDANHPPDNKTLLCAVIERLKSEHQTKHRRAAVIVGTYLLGLLNKL